MNYVPSTTKAKRASLTTKALRAMLKYNKQTGIFVWRIRPDRSKSWNSRYAGRVAGYMATTDGAHWYWVIRINDYPTQAHILAWKYCTGHWPKYLLDHKNGNGLDNRWKNIRPANRQQNSANSKCYKNNKTGLKGVCQDHGKYRATIGIGGKQIWLGRFNTAYAAHRAYLKAATQYHGEFARVA